MRTREVIVLMLTLGFLTGVALAADAPNPEATASDRTPPRLSFVDGQVSFWRPGAQDWAQAQVNTPLAPGDELATASPGNLEVQIGARDFVRAWANTQVGLANQEPDFLQFTVTTGTASFDLRTIEAGRTVEVDTPHAAFTIERAGYYRVDVTGERTAFITRRGGRATVTPGSGAAVAIEPSEEVIIEGPASERVASYAAPPLDAWDRWNYARTEHLLDAVSARYVSPDAYGVSDLDRYGAWRVVPSYGAVWVPTAMPSGWVPYSTGSWTLDPFYGWTWVDAAPWGWAPYHYGRWVDVDGFWAWAPGPVVVRPVYAPALVAFFGGPGVGVSISLGGPVVGWVALGWGEPVVPWWGREGFIRGAVMAGLGRPARREQHGHQQHDRGQRAEHQRLPQQQRAERRGGGARRPLRPWAHHVGARRTGGCDKPPADAHRAPDCRDARELRAHGEPRRPATRRQCPAAGGRHAPTAHRVGGGRRRRAESRAGRGAHARAAPRLGAAAAREQPGSGSSSLRPEHGRAPHRGSRPTAAAAGGAQESAIAAAAAAGAAEGDPGAHCTPAITGSCGNAAGVSPSRRSAPGHRSGAGHTPTITESCGNAAASGRSPRGACGHGSGADRIPAVIGSCGGATAGTSPRGARGHGSGAKHTRAVTESCGNAAAVADPSSRAAAGDDSGAGRGSAAGPARRDTPRAHTSTAGRARQSPRSEPWAGYAEILSPRDQGAS